MEGYAQRLEEALGTMRTGLAGVVKTAADQVRRDAASSRGAIAKEIDNTLKRIDKGSGALLDAVTSSLAEANHRIDNLLQVHHGDVREKSDHSHSHISDMFSGHRKTVWDTVERNIAGAEKLTKDKQQEADQRNRSDIRACYRRGGAKMNSYGNTSRGKYIGGAAFDVADDTANKMGEQQPDILSGIAEITAPVADNFRGQGAQALDGFDQNLPKILDDVTSAAGDTDADLDKQAQKARGDLDGFGRQTRDEITALAADATAQVRAFKSQMDGQIDHALAQMLQELNATPARISGRVAPPVKEAMELLRTTRQPNLDAAAQLTDVLCGFLADTVTQTGATLQQGGGKSAARFQQISGGARAAMRQQSERTDKIWKEAHQGLSSTVDKMIDGVDTGLGHSVTTLGDALDGTEKNITDQLSPVISDLDRSFKDCLADATAQIDQRIADGFSKNTEALNDLDGKMQEAADDAAYELDHPVLSALEFLAGIIAGIIEVLAVLLLLLVVTLIIASVLGIGMLAAGLVLVGAMAAFAIGAGFGARLAAGQGVGEAFLGSVTAFGRGVPGMLYDMTGIPKLRRAFSSEPMSPFKRGELIGQGGTEFVMAIFMVRGAAKGIASGFRRLRVAPVDAEIAARPKLEVGIGRERIPAATDTPTAKVEVPRRVNVEIEPRAAARTAGPAEAPTPPRAGSPPEVETAPGAEQPPAAPKATSAPEATSAPKATSAPEVRQGRMPEAPEEEPAAKSETDAPERRSREGEEPEGGRRQKAAKGKRGSKQGEEPENDRETVEAKRGSKRGSKRGEEPEGGKEPEGEKRQRAKEKRESKEGEEPEDRTRRKRGAKKKAAKKKAGKKEAPKERKPTKAEKRVQAKRDADTAAAQREFQGLEQQPKSNPSVKELESGTEGTETGPERPESPRAMVQRKTGAVSEDLDVAQKAGSEFERPMVRDFAGRQPKTSSTFGSSLRNWADLRTRFPRIGELFGGGERPDAVSVNTRGKSIRLFDSTSRPSAEHMEGSVEYADRLVNDPQMQRQFGGWRVTVEERYWEAGNTRRVFQVERRIPTLAGEAPEEVPSAGVPPEGPTAPRGGSSLEAKASAGPERPPGTPEATSAPKAGPGRVGETPEVPEAPEKEPAGKSEADTPERGEGGKRRTAKGKSESKQGEEPEDDREPVKAKRGSKQGEEPEGGKRQRAKGKRKSKQGEEPEGAPRKQGAKKTSSKKARAEAGESGEARAPRTPPGRNITDRGTMTEEQFKASMKTEPHPYVYEIVDPEGTHLKWGIAMNPYERFNGYVAEGLGGSSMRVFEPQPRFQALGGETAGIEAELEEGRGGLNVREQTRAEMRGGKDWAEITEPPRPPGRPRITIRRAPRPGAGDRGGL